MNYERPELLEKLSAEYVLGTLHGAARRRFERVLKRHATARAAVARWEECLHPLSNSVTPEAPPERVWRGIESRIAPAAARARMPWWKPLLGMALGVVMGIGIVLVAPDRFLSLDDMAQREQALPQSYVGLMLDRNGKPTVLASATRHGNRMSLKMLQPVTVPTGKVLKMWALPRDENGNDLPPFALGNLPAKGKGEFVMTGSAEVLLSNVPRLGVSLETEGSTPTTPSEFVLSGHCVKLW